MILYFAVFITGVIIGYLFHFILFAHKEAKHFNELFESDKKIREDFDQLSEDVRDSLVKARGRNEKMSC